MAAVTAPERTAAQHQSLLHFVGEGRWSDEKVLAKVREMSPAGEIVRHGQIKAQDYPRRHGFPQTGPAFGKEWHGSIVVNSASRTIVQVAVSLSIANRHASLPVAYRLYLPEQWAADDVRRRQDMSVPEDIRFRTEPEIALRADPRGQCSRAAARCGADGRRIWLQHGTARQHQRTGIDLCGRHLAEHHGMGAGHGAVASQNLVGPRTAAKIDTA